jgi:hypothetical protein
VAHRSPVVQWTAHSNPSVERVIGSIRRESLDHVIVFNEWHLLRVLRTYVAYYQRSRTHLALGKDAPVERAVQPTGRIVVRPEVGGLHHRYERQASRSRFVAPGMRPQLDVGGLPADPFRGISRTEFDRLHWRWPARLVDVSLPAN